MNIIERKEEIIGLVDCNNFFVSCERTQNPELEGRPVVVLSNNDGCVVARSNEAKAMGIRMGQPAFELRELLAANRVTALSGNHLLYRDISIRIHNIFRRYAPSTADYSVDEAFLDMGGIPREEIRAIGTAIVEACMREEKIPVTIGFAPSKTLAKVATEVGKKRGERVILLFEERAWRPLLQRLQAGDIWGIGRRIAKRLYAKGIFTALQFADRPLIWVRRELGVTGERTWRELHGESCIELSHLERPLQDSISETRTFPTDIDDFDYLRARIAIYCSHVGKRLRAQGGECGEISVFLRTNRFHLEKGYYAPTATGRFDPPTNDTPIITSRAISLLDKIYQEGIAYKRAGVILSHITPIHSYTPSLFDEDEAERQRQLKSRKLMQAIDSLNSNLSRQTVQLAAQLSVRHLGHNDGYSSSFGPAKEC